MANFRGYLLKGTKNGAVFPSSFIKLDTWDSTPRQIEYLKAYRDDNTRNMTKVAASGRKSTFKFTLRKMNLADRINFDNFLSANKDGEDYKLEYWDDKGLMYRTGSFYMPNPSFKIIKHSTNDIEYDEHDVEFIEN